MGSSQSHRSPLPATVRAEELLDRSGQRIAIFALQARQRLQKTVASIRAEADSMDQLSRQNEAAPGEQQAVQSSTTVGISPSGTARAEDIIDNWVQRIGATATVSGLQVQRFVARMREEVEDIWAEAQDIQGHRKGRGWQGRQSDGEASETRNRAEWRAGK